MADRNDWHVGNAADDGCDHRGWFVGHFLDGEGIRTAKDVEVKWGIHPAGEERASWHGDEYRTTVLLLIRGCFRTHLLTDEGDYAMWGPGIGHSWKAEEDSVVLTIRWPSLD